MSMWKSLYWRTAIAAGSLMAWVGPMLAADLGGATPQAHASSPSPVASPSWTGCGVGAHAGYSVANTKADINATGVGSIIGIDGFSGDSFAAGLSVSCDLQVDRFVIGAFADYTWADRETKITLLGGVATASYSLRDQWAVGARAGVLIHPAVLAYGLVGYTGMGADDLTLSGPGGSVSFGVPDFRGWVFGGGLETALANNLFLKGEYRFSRYDRETVGLAPGLGLDLEPDVHSVHVGITWKFGASVLSPK